MSAREDLREKLLAASKAGIGLPVTRTLALRLPVDGIAFNDITLDLTPRDLMKAAEQMALDERELAGRAARIVGLETQLARAHDTAARYAARVASYEAAERRRDELHTDPESLS